MNDKRVPIIRNSHILCEIKEHIMTKLDLCVSNISTVVIKQLGASQREHNVKVCGHFLRILQSMHMDSHGAVIQVTQTHTHMSTAHYPFFFLMVSSKVLKYLHVYTACDVLWDWKRNT